MKGKILSICVFLGAVVVAIAMLSGGTAKAQVNGGTVVYNFYATDGYVPLVDGTAVYIYGFIGDRQDGLGFTYQNRCTPYGGDGSNPRTRVCDWPGITTASGDLPAPTAGPVTVQESELLGQAQLPGPVIYAAVGQTVEIRLKNLGKTTSDAPSGAHSLHIDGLGLDAANDGVPETSLAAVAGNLCATGEYIGQAEIPVEEGGGPVIGYDSPNPLTRQPVAVASCDAWNYGAVYDESGALLGNPYILDFGGPAPGASNVVVYTFTATQAGTYMYHCHQEANVNVQMGMYGALVVYDPDDAGAVNGPGYSGEIYGVPYDRDYIMLLTEVDLDYHTAKEGTYQPEFSNFGRRWNPVDYHPQYWLINGLSFPNTIHASTAPAVGIPGVNWDEWILAHAGYDPFIRGSVSTANPEWGTPGEKVLVRMINLGFQTQPMQVHGYHGKVVGSDARGWDWGFAPKSKANKMGVRPFGEGLEKNSFLIGSGETYDVLFDLGQQNTEAPYYSLGTQSCLSVDGVTPLSADDPNCSGLPVNSGEDTYILGPQVTGLFRDNLGGAVPGAADGQFFPFLNHDFYKSTNDGEYPGGAITMIQVQP
jgi:FtsP/CotA-like multicopper oxidase with cupredoxin domain